MSPHPNDLSRRSLLVGTGALIVEFSLARAGSAQDAALAPKPEKLPGSLAKTPLLDAWLRIDADGRVTVLTGKCELGQGIKTALIQIAAEELGVTPTHITLITADTAQTANEGYTSGSHSMQDSGTAIQYAAAQARGLLLAAAAQKLGVDAGSLTARDGAVLAPDGRKVGYGELVAADTLHVQAIPHPELRDPTTFKLIGTAMPRVDIPAKLTGGNAYVQDMRLPGMVHARVVRPPSYAARLAALDTTAVEKTPGFVKVVRDGNFLAVVAEREYQAIVAMRLLAAHATWAETPSLPDQNDIYGHLLSLPSRDATILDVHADAAAATKTVDATFHRPYQAHGSIGPSCAVAELRDGALTVWSHAQGMFPLRKAIAQMLHLDDGKVRCIHVEGSGCYGHNGADDAAGDAAVIARALPGRPVRVQWMREQEHTWEPYGPVMVSRARAGLDAAGHVVDWAYEVWSNTHSMRPGPAGSLLAAQSLATPFPPPAPRPIPLPEGGGDRNAIPLYKFPNARVVHHFVPTMPLRISAMRGLGAYMNIFSIESFVDQLARTAGVDPVEFRRRHLDDPRALAVIATAAEKFGWAGWTAPATGRGRGFAFARYKNLAAYAAIALDVSVEHETGRVRVVRAVAAVDSGQAVNPDGLRNQIEGGIIQSLSWTLYETVTYDRTRITSRDWSSYPILRFPAVPGSVDVHVIDRPGQPFLGTGEAAQGPTAAALANAIEDAVGVRLTELPLTAERVKAAIGA